jgi:hypothetical protein
MKLKDLVRNGDFCIVGNSPKELGKGSGPKIDSYSCVIRINNFVVSEEYKEDYGKKTTVWAHSFCYDINPKEEMETVVCPLPLNTWGVIDRYHWTDVAWMKRDEYKTEYAPNDVFHELLDSVTEPSTGLALLYWISQYVDIKEDQVFGFDFFGRGERGVVTSHYWGEGVKTAHSGEQEYNLFKKIVVDKDAG